MFQVLLRIYGQVHGERAMDAIVTESVIFTLLSERRLGPKLHGVFSGGRIEEYIPARPFLTRELAEPALSMKIAEKMAAIHSMDVPLSKEASWLWKTLYKWNKTVKEERLSGSVQGKLRLAAKEASWLWKTLYKWNKTVKEERLSGSVQGKNEEEKRIIKRLKTVDFDKEIEWLKKFIATVDSPVVFCHNDMQEGNILMLEDLPQTDEEPTEDYNQSYRESDSIPRSNRPSFEPLTQYDDTNTIDSILSSHISDSGEPRLVLIDFEYCAYNYRGFDIANHFQEWSYDYTNPEYPFYYENQENSPNLEQKEIFIREYLEHYQHNATGKDSPPHIDDVNRLLHEVDAFALASQLLWSLWSIVNASKSQIPFGYWEYGLSRLDTYFRLKQEVVKKDKFGAQKRKICEVDI
ncbi:hypothetical protein MSG28_015496 [Choristoneura fumiferana]|uniref:Uncharacterized protein n=1 Tax=Choristoneura fumiferana TaxID=7141 RepID=A0ACC0KB88_CHOFU|nr:hypothetical protein MSG28_015496 [Choristoneura fumiferana]